METGTEEIIRTIREDPFLSVMFSCYERAVQYDMPFYGDFIYR